jgi:hypothetical protein
MVGRWRYFLTCPDRIEDGFTAVFRLREGAPLLSLEMAGVGVWARSDRMYRVHFFGSDDDEFHEVDRDQAAAVLRNYLQRGYFSSLPDLDAPGLDDEFIAAAQEADDQADAAWRDVSRPPGTGNIGG